MIFLDRINKSLDYFLSKHINNYLIGEDILDPYGGAFKVSKGLSNKYGKQVIATPISESGFVGMATGMTFTGANVVVEIMFSDFLTIISDTLINTLSKISLISNDLINGKIIIRTPNGGRRGYGPIHSQSLEKIFFGFSEINIISLNRFIDPLEVYKKIFSEKYKHKINLILETKIDYPRKIISDDYLQKFNFRRIYDNSEIPIIELCNERDFDNKTDFLFLCYGGVTQEVFDAAVSLFLEEELTSRILIPQKINPIQDSLIKKVSASKYKKLVIVEENTSNSSWGSLFTSKILSNDIVNNELVNNIMLLGSESELISANINDENTNLINAKKIYSKLVNIL
jgi:pyruvate/2-oxoglutarate/acetoin dehydrogenase E1 component